MADANTDQSKAVADVPNTTYTLNGDERVTEAKDPAGNKRSKTYTALGDVATSTDGNGKVSTMTYGANGGESLTASQSASGATVKAAYGNSSTATNPTGAFQPSTSTDVQNNVTAYTYNGPGNLQSAKDATAAQADVDYNGDGTVKTSTDPKNKSAGNSTKYGYTNKQLTSLTPVTGASLKGRAFTYDAYGRLATSTDGAGNTTTYTYDDDDHVTKISAGALSNVLTYDNAGNLKTATDAHGTTTYDYNTRNWLTGLTDSADTYTAFSYDDDGNRTYAYFGAKPDDTSTWAARQQWQYNDSNQITRITVLANSANLTKVADTSYCWVTHTNGVDCPTGKSASNTGLVSWSKNNVTGTTAVYTYDKANRITKATGVYGHDYSYTYDSDGNRTNHTQDSTGYDNKFNTANQLVFHDDGSDTDVTYDGAGNQTVSPVGRKLGYNAFGQMASNDGGAYTYAGTTNNELLAAGTRTYTWGLNDSVGKPWLQSYTAAGTTGYINRDGDSPYTYTDPTGQSTFTELGETFFGVGGALEGAETGSVETALAGTVTDIGVDVGCNFVLGLAAPETAGASLAVGEVGCMALGSEAGSAVMEG
ncbi:hypothetical protein [Actinomadura parmotrematis]|uniref:RHS repeat protein n=1 Tax=Actinomadura parmotrematis TaxID=2864039 RepID=A0ABS7G3D1_9ACTN|nr:hypothetical protein [Actinomadura parmotrematis]MBW8486327.1 hypothetical protein [Actinomadura parmotrematis]